MNALRMICVNFSLMKYGSNLAYLFSEWIKMTMQPQMEMQGHFTWYILNTNDQMISIKSFIQYLPETYNVRKNYLSKITNQNQNLGKKLFLEQVEKNCSCYGISDIETSLRRNIRFRAQNKKCNAKASQALHGKIWTPTKCYSGRDSYGTIRCQYIYIFSFLSVVLGLT